MTLAYTYDEGSELTGLTWTKAGTTLGEVTYSYDYAGRMTQMASTLGGVNLPSAVSPTMYNAANQLTQWGTAALSYDLNGNLASDGTYSYTWNARNQLVGGNLQYDAFGRRTRNPAGTSFLYDGANPMQELSGSTVTANLLGGLGIDEIFTRADSTGTYSFLTDRLGSTVALADSNGTLQTQYSYEPFGKTTASGPTSTNTYQFTGRENDGTGLYYYRARYYSPAFQRFLSEDPIRIQGGVNLYAYALQDPIGAFDPLGLDSIVVSGGPRGTVYLYHDDGSLVGSYPYTSGMYKDNRTLGGGSAPVTYDYARKGVGPIPPGDYTIYPTEISPAGFFRKYIDPRDWGNYRVTLHPDNGTDTYGRAGFFLHGGHLRPGSEGCVKVGGPNQDHSRPN